MSDSDDNDLELIFDRSLTEDEFDDVTTSESAAPTPVTFSTQDYPVDGLVKRLNSGAMKVPQFGGEDSTSLTAGFQRGFVWSKAQMDRFIESLLLGYPVPGIFLVKQETDNVMLVLDGQQRLETLRRFYEGVHDKKEFVLTNVSDQFKGLTYKTLDESLGLKIDDSFMQATIVPTDGSSEVSEAVFQIFERLNSGGTQLTPHEIRVALYAGPLVDCIEVFNNDPNWRDLFGIKSKRIRDHELITRILALYVDSASYKRPLKGFLNNFARDYRQESDVHGAEFLAACRHINSTAGPSAFRSREGRQVNTAQAEAIVVGVMRAVANGAVPEDLRSKIQSLKDDAEFITVTTRSTADNEFVVKRLDLATDRLSRSV